eukprot:TRINITY_DN1246_c0_g1_i5.p1 TRINITY_DN1246_c0_g1~~TRINITY_DN1246_c0_g1_i5.p1  ORF type:complete len:806 (+),score=130.58 TRINITY_DN1246_c0_g1_i5:255-2672(+)
METLCSIVQGYLGSFGAVVEQGTGPEDAGRHVRVAVESVGQDSEILAAKVKDTDVRMGEECTEQYPEEREKQHLDGQLLQAPAALVGVAGETNAYEGVEEAKPRVPRSPDSSMLRMGCRLSDDDGMAVASKVLEIHAVSGAYAEGTALDPLGDLYHRLANEDWAVITCFLTLAVALREDAEEILPSQAEHNEDQVNEDTAQEIADLLQEASASGMRHIVRHVGVANAERLAVEALELVSEKRGLALDGHGSVRTPGGCFMALGKALRAENRQREKEEGTSVEALAVVELRPRPYQLEVIGKSLDSNSIVVLPTGTGKTLVSAEVILHKLPNGHSITKNVICVQKTKIMVEQAADALRHHFKSKARTDLQVRSYHSEGSVPYASWEGEKQYSNVQVMTAAVLCNLLDRHLLRISEILLLVFDEAHDCKAAHPYMKIMEQYRAAQATGKAVPQILGLTATPAYANNELGTEQGIQALERNMDSALVLVQKCKANLEEHTPERTCFPTPVHRDERDIHLSELVKQAMCQLELVLGDVAPMSVGVDGEQAAHTHHYRQELLRLQAVEADLDDDRATAELLVHMLCACSQAVALLQEGLTGWATAVGAVSASLVSLLATTHKGMEWLFQDVVDSIGPLMEQSVARMGETSQSHPAKVTALEAILLESKPTRTIVFVQTRQAAQALTRWLGVHPTLQKTVRPACFIGHGDGGVGMSTRAQLKVRMDFRQGIFNLIVATSVAEEGLDFPDCDLVIRFNSVPNARADLQSQGRVRKSGGKYYCVFFTDDQEERGAYRAVTQAECLANALESRA